MQRGLWPHLSDSPPGVGCGVWGEGGVEELSFAETSSLSALVHAENARAPTTAELGAIV